MVVVIHYEFENLSEPNKFTNIFKTDRKDKMYTWFGSGPLKVLTCLNILLSDGIHG